MNNRTWTSAALLFFILVVALSGGAAWWFLLHKPAAASRVFQMLPENTVALVYVPDPQGTALRWRETSLFHLWSEPALQALLQKPLSQLPSDGDLQMVQRAISTPGVKDFFVSLTATSPPTLLIGLQAEENAQEIDRVIADVERRLKSVAHEGTSGMVTKDGLIFRTFTSKDQTFAATTAGSWRLWSNNMDAIRNALAVPTKSVESGQSLQNASGFKRVTDVLPSTYEGLVFLNFVPLRDALLGLSVSAPGSEEAIKSISNIDAFGGFIEFNGAQIHEVIRLAFVDAQESPAKLDGSSLRYTTAETVALYQTVLSGAPVDLDQVEKAANTTPVLSSLTSAVAALRAQGISNESIAKAFGPESAIQVDWGKNDMQPKIFFRLGVRDHAQAAKVVETLTGSALGTPWKKRAAKTPNVDIYTMPVQPALMQPLFSLGLNAENLVFGMNPLQVEQFLKRPEPGVATVEGNAPFKEAVKQVQTNGTTFVYIDSKGFFSQVYSSIKGALRIMNIFSGSAGALPLEKLPKTEELSRHLQPFSMWCTMEGKVLRMESVGPVTFTQAMAGVALGLTGVAVSQGLIGEDSGFSLPNFFPRQGATESGNLEQEAEHQ